VPPRKIACFPNGIDCAAFQVEPDSGAIPGFHRAEGETVVGTVAAIR
jgi:hypothetical protein